MEELRVMTQQKQAEGTPVVYYVSGVENSECVVFIHAAFADHTQFNPQVNAFSDKYKVIVPDIIGHGNSRNVAKGGGIGKMADYIKVILDNENVEKAHLAGVSLGAVVVQDFANKYPERIKSIACFGGYDINNFDSKEQKENSKGQAGMMLKAIFSIKKFAEDNKKISAYTEQAQQDFYEMNIRFPKKSFMYLGGLGKLVNKQKTKPRTYGLMIGCGEHDIAAAGPISERWHESEPESRLVVFEGAGHLVNMDVPGDFNEVMTRFIEENRSR